MHQETPHNPGLVEYAVAASPFPGESESGDHYVVVPTERGVLLAAMDGLGHGTEAAEAARVAVETLQSYPDDSIIALVRRCHEKMKNTRGAAMSIAFLSGHYHTLTWLSVGNVEGALLRGSTDGNQSDENILMCGGAVGFRLPRLYALTVDIAPGDLLIFATDGIRGGFSADLRRTDPPHQIADHICSRYNKGNDDALVLVARYVGIAKTS